MSIKHTRLIWLVPLFVAWCFDFLFWKKAPGISFFIFTLLCVAGGLVLAYLEDRRPAWKSLLLVAPIMFFAAATFTRNEPFTIFVSILVTLILLAVFALTLRSGSWLRYSLSDYVVNLFRLGINMLSKPVTYAAESRRNGPSAPPVETGGQIPPARPQLRAGAVLRGLLLAFPVVLVMAMLLASADPIFSKALGNILQFFKLEKLAEYLFRTIYILAGAYLLLGVYLYAMFNSQESKLIGVEKPLIPPSLGWTEAVIVLGAVDLLFAFFVAIQFRYFFGGQANINLAGYTYAEYARRGFFELVVTAVLSLMLFWGLCGITRRAGAFERRAFSGLGIALVALVSVMLVSAFNRLYLYESAYGFSRVRTYTHVFMIWLGILLALTVVLEIAQRERGFGLALALVVLSFGVTLFVLNVDAFIVDRNVARAQSGEELDTSYLIQLSDDAVPALVERFNDPELPAGLKDQLGGALACRAEITDKPKTDLPWQSFNLSRWKAWQALNGVEAELKAYPVELVGRQWMVTVGGQQKPCYDDRTRVD